MKTVKVHFEDGSVRDCPAKEKLLHSNEIPPQPPTTTLVPIETPELSFFQTIGAWHARERR